MIEIKIRVSDVDYEGASEVLLPKIMKHLAKKSGNPFLKGVLSKTKDISSTAAVALLKTLSKEKKDELAVMCLNYYQDKITRALVEASEKEGISLKVQGMEVINHTEE